MDAIGRPAETVATDVRKDPAVKISRLAYSATDRRGRPIEILRDVDLQARVGEFVAIVGPSGCGKSTLLNFISGLRTNGSCAVEVFGEPVVGVNPKIGYMFQSHALLPWRTVFQNVELGLELLGLSREERQRRSRAILGQLGLEGFGEHYPAELSGGMRQRVSLARTLVVDPQVLLMDEPFGALDAQTKLLIQEMFLDYWERHRKTVLFVTHDLSEAILMADRVLVMSARPGRVKSEYVIDLPRPRTLAQMRAMPRFTEYWERVWEDLRSEAMVSMQGRAND